MTVLRVTAAEEYEKDSKLKPEDVKKFLDWYEKQPHLPKITEPDAILFLNSCYYNNELAKNTIDIFFTVKTIVNELFSNRNPNSDGIQKHIDVVAHLPLPKKTPEGYSIFFSKLLICDPDYFHFASTLRIWDMMVMLHLHQFGTAEGHVIALDFRGVTLGHVTKLGIMTIKKFLYYLQEAMPIRLKAIHFFNTVPFMDKILALLKPFMKKETWDILYLHENMESLSKRVPLECFPKDYGGSSEEVSQAHEKMKQNLIDNSDFFAHDEEMRVDESSRPGKPKSANEVFGVEGTFKKLDLD